MHRRGRISGHREAPGAREAEERDDDRQDLHQWDETHSELWSHQPIRLEHEMHKSPAFSMDDLAELIESYPREHYSLVQDRRAAAPAASGARATSAISAAGR